MMKHFAPFSSAMRPMILPIPDAPPVINTFALNDNGVYEVNLDIVCERANHKAILIGKQGKAIKEVSSFARQDMEKFLGAKVFLTTYVKVKEDWRDKLNLIKEYGYEEYKE